MIDVERALNNYINDLNSSFASIKDYAIEIGVVSDNSRRKKIKIASIGLTNAELMFIHENGSVLKHIPARPVLQYTIQDTIKTFLPQTINNIYDKCFTVGMTKDEVRKELEILCVRMQSHARKMIYRRDSRLAPNSRHTIAKKHSDLPLFDTGQLARSITCKLVKLHS